MTYDIHRRVRENIEQLAAFGWLLETLLAGRVFKSLQPISGEKAPISSTDRITATLHSTMAADAKSVQRPSANKS